MQAVSRTILLLAYLALADGLGLGPIAPLTSRKNNNFSLTFLYS